MSAEHDTYYNLAERIDDAFSEIDSDVCSDLRNNDGGYAQMWREVLELQEAFPIVVNISEGDGAISLSAEERKALARYLYLKNGMEDMERKRIYFRGHTDNYAYLKKIGAV
jgi:hypothetical protein